MSNVQVIENETLQRIDVKNLLDAQPADPRFELLMGVMHLSQSDLSDRYLLEAAHGFGIASPEESRFSDPTACAFHQLSAKLQASR